jgi:glycosyltransferase involved in cell wall biosynthesis
MQPEEASVLMFGWELPPFNSGGLGVACYGLARGLSKRGVSVSFGLPKPLPAHIAFMRLMDYSSPGFEVTGINSHLVSYQTNQHYLKAKPKWAGIHGKDIYEEAHLFARKAEAWSKVTPHNLIHAHDWMSYPAAMRASKVSGKPFLAHVHATEFDRTGGYVDERIAGVEYHGLKSADHIIAVSNYTKDTISKHYSISPTKISVVHNGIDTKDFEPISLRTIFPEDHVVLYVGRLTFQKGVKYFLEAAAKVLEEVPNTIFLVVGDGDMYQQHILEAAGLRIGHRVIFTGFLGGDQLRSAYQMADVFVMPSVSEPYGLVALEAIASGTPTIISKQSGVAETIQHVFKLDFWDTNKMASTIEQALLFPNQARDFNRLAQIELGKLSWDQSAAKTLAIYQQFLA